jgi:hypothetical protein
LRLTGEILFKQPFRIDFVQWDINSAGTYSLQQVNSVAASPTVVRTIANDIIVTTLTKVTVPVWPPLYAACGDLIYLSIVTTPTVQMRRFATNVVSFQSFSYTSIGYDGGSTTTGSIPTKLVGKYWEVKR